MSQSDFYIYQKAHALAKFMSHTVEGHTEYLLFVKHCMDMSMKMLKGEDVSYYVTWFTEWFDTASTFGVVWNEETFEW
jgi:hypothetical protein